MPKNRRLHPGWLALALLLTVAALTPRPAQAVEVGDQAPTFSLTDQDGNTRSLETLRGENQAVLVFFRGLW